MNIILNIQNKFILIYDIKSLQIVNVIDLDYGLIRYLTNILSKYVISKNAYGYLQIENISGDNTYLHRINLEYYSKFNVKLYSIRTNPIYEVNHINKNVWDNRLENLEIVTKKGNLLH